MGTKGLILPAGVVGFVGLYVLAGCDEGAPRMLQSTEPSSVRAIAASELLIGQAIEIDPKDGERRRKIVTISKGDSDEQNEESKSDISINFGSLSKGKLCSDPGADCENGRGRINGVEPVGEAPPDVEWHASAGYALVRGWRPRARTNRATAAAEGTEFFVQIDTSVDPAIHRFVLLEGGPLMIHLRQGGEMEWMEGDAPMQLGQKPTPVEILDLDKHYVEVSKNVDGKVSVSKPIPLSDDRALELQKLINIVQSNDFAVSFKPVEPRPTTPPSE